MQVNVSVQLTLYEPYPDVEMDEAADEILRALKGNAQQDQCFINMIRTGMSGSAGIAGPSAGQLPSTEPEPPPPEP